MWVDPMHDMVAAEKAVEHKWKTNSQISSDLGTNYDNNIKEFERETSMIVKDSDNNVPVLNGAQISSALSVVQQYASGAIDADPAIALLTASGVPAASAENMIKKQKVTNEKTTA